MQIGQLLREFELLRFLGARAKRLLDLGESRFHIDPAGGCREHLFEKRAFAELGEFLGQVTQSSPLGEDDAPAVGNELIDHDSEEGALSAPVGAHQPEPVASLHRQGEVLEQGSLSEVERDFIEGEERHGAPESRFAAPRADAPSRRGHARKRCGGGWRRTRA